MSGGPAAKKRGVFRIFCGTSLQAVLACTCTRAQEGTKRKGSIHSIRGILKVHPQSTPKASLPFCSFLLWLRREASHVEIGGAHAASLISLEINFTFISLAQAA